MRGRTITVVALVILGSVGLFAFSDAGTTQTALTIDDTRANNVTLADLAEGLYDANNVVIYPVNESAFLDTFPDHDLYVVYDLKEYPAKERTMAVFDNDQSRDVTRDYNTIMSDAGVVIDTSDEALTYAKALAQTANPNHLPIDGRELVNASDSDRLNYSIEDPEVQSKLDVLGWAVSLYTYSPVNGMIAEWQIDLAPSEVNYAYVDVEAVGNGPARRTWQTSLLTADNRLYNDYDGGHELTAHNLSSGEVLRVPDDPGSLNWTNTSSTATTFDNSTWLAQKPAGTNWTGQDTAFADELVRAGNWSHEWLVVKSSQPCANVTNDRGWDTQPDPGCTLEVRVFPDDVVYCAACFNRSAGDHLQVYVHDATLRRWLDSAVEWDRAELPTDGRNVSRLVVGQLHEVFLGAHDDAQALPEADGPTAPDNETLREQAEDIAEHRVVISYENGTPEDDPDYVDRYNGTIVDREETLEFIVVRLNPSNRTALIDDALEDPNVTAAENSSIGRTAHEPYEPNDILYQQGLQWGVEGINLTRAWTNQTGSQQINIHILDTGVDYTHLDLAPNLSTLCKDPPQLGASFVTPWHNNNPAVPGAPESGYHGTHVTGIAGALIDNSRLGRAGASQVCITPVRVAHVFYYLDTMLANGIKWSADHGADIISMSLTGEDRGSGVGRAVSYAKDQGVFMVAAAGNDGCDENDGDDDVDYPAARGPVVGVSALDEDAETFASYSSCGTTEAKPNVTAVGTNIWSTTPGNT